MRLSELWVYPVKSLGGISLDTAEVEERGLRHDRRWMVVDAGGHFLTQRELPVMAQVQVALAGDRLVLRHRRARRRSRCRSRPPRASGCR